MENEQAYGIKVQSNNFEFEEWEKVPVYATILCTPSIINTIALSLLSEIDIDIVYVHAYAENRKIIYNESDKK